MAEIGYVYNRAAANLRSASVGLVGLVINDLRNPFFTEFATTLQMTLAAEGYATVIANSDEDPELQARLVGSMIEHGVAALVISPAYGEAEGSFDQLARTGLPVLQVLRRMDERTDLFPFASFDYAAGSTEATRHLIAQGARHIAFVGGLPGRAITRERKSGWREVLKFEGLDEVALHGKSTRAFGMQAAETLMADHPEVDAAVCFNDLVALGLIAGFARAGRPVGEGFRVVGFDDIEEAAQSWPQLSSVSCDIAGFARDTAARLLAWMVEGQRPEPEIRMPVRLVARASSSRV
jgi:LacI family transcriptional regulator